MIGIISLYEMSKARCYWLTQAQFESMPQELFDLRCSGKLVQCSSCLKALSPFIDSQGLLRVGGKIADPPVDNSIKHPIVLPAKSLVLRHIFKYKHIRLIHAGPQALLVHASLVYWTIQGRQMATQKLKNVSPVFEHSLSSYHHNGSATQSTRYSFSTFLQQ